MRKLGMVFALAAATGLLGVARVHAAPKRSFETAVKKVQATIQPASAKRGETVTWKLTVELEPGWHTYPLKQVDPNANQNVTKIEFLSTSDLVPVGAFKEPAYHAKAEPLLDITELRYNEGTVTWERPVVIRPGATPGSKSFEVRVELQVCDDKGCLPTRKLVLQSPITITDAAAVPVDPKYASEIPVSGTEVAPKPEPAKETTEPAKGEAPKVEPAKADGKVVLVAPDETDDGTAARRAQLEAILPQLAAAPAAPTDLLSFILSGIFWGAISLVTPCVFPMIPITVSFFLKQSEKEHHRPIAMAVVYCTTIVVVLTLAAILLLSVFRELSVHPVTNFIIGGLFIFFALSLFGMFEIELPSFMTRFTSSREGQGGLAGTVFMALTFTIVSFSCVAPFLGGFGGTSATSTMTWPQRIFGGLAFSMTFASPFFVLALFPTLLKKMPKSGSWLNSVKVVMGFLEIAAALKFFRTAEVRMNTGFFTYDWVLGLYIALSLLCGLYLLGMYRLPHDTPNEHLGVPRMLLAMTFLAMAIYLIPGLFRGAGGEKQRPGGVLFAWIDSFLLPDEEPRKGDLAWSGNLPRAIAEARKQRKETGKPQYVFIDFTGKTCVNCKINERDVFPREEIQKAFRPFHLVKMYTDEVPRDLYPPSFREKIDKARQDQDADVNAWFQQAAFQGNEQLPLYVILEPMLDNQIKVTDLYTEGKINDPSAFAAFLRKPWELDATAQAKAE